MDRSLYDQIVQRLAVNSIERPDFDGISRECGVKQATLFSIYSQQTLKKVLKGDQFLRQEAATYAQRYLQGDQSSHGAVQVKCLSTQTRQPASTLLLIRDM
jgi:hypothetical protein